MPGVPVVSATMTACNSKLNTADARAKTLAMRKLLLEGIDPINKRASERLVEDKPVIPTFDICAYKYITEHEQTWKNEKHRAQWRSTILMYASPIIGAMPVNEVEDHTWNGLVELDDEGKVKSFTKTH